MLLARSNPTKTSEWKVKENTPYIGAARNFTQLTVCRVDEKQQTGQSSNVYQNVYQIKFTPALYSWGQYQQTLLYCQHRTSPIDPNQLVFMDLTTRKVSGFSSASHPYFRNIIVRAVDGVAVIAGRMPNTFEQRFIIAASIKNHHYYVVTENASSETITLSSNENTMTYETAAGKLTAEIFSPAEFISQSENKITETLESLTKLPKVLNQVIASYATNAKLYFFSPSAVSKSIQITELNPTQIADTKKHTPKKTSTMG